MPLPAATWCVGVALGVRFASAAGDPDAAGGVEAADVDVAVGELGGLGGVDPVGEAGADFVGDAGAEDGGAEDDGAADDGGGAPICAGGGNWTTLVWASAAFMNAAHIWAGNVPP